MEEVKEVQTEFQTQPNEEKLTQKEEKEIQEEKNKEDIERLQTEISYWKDLALRYAAEVENLKKSLKKEKEEFYKFALEAVFRELLPAIDNLERALESFSTTQNLEALKQGVELTLKSIVASLEKFGLKQFIPSVGETFHPAYHEALATEPHPEFPNGSITKVYQKGYILHGRVLRPALVCVCMGKEKPSPTQEEKKVGIDSIEEIEEENMIKEG